MISSVPGKLGRAFRKFKLKGKWGQGFFNCPTQITLYNLNMGGVDRADQRMSYFKFHVRCKRAYMHLFFWYVMLNAHNARIAYADLTGNESMTTRRFILELCRGLMALSKKYQPVDQEVDHRRDGPKWWLKKEGSGVNLETIKQDAPANRLEGKHWPSTKKGIRRQCRMCVSIALKRGWNRGVVGGGGVKGPSKTSNACDTCQAFICANCSKECWRIWHSEADPWRRENWEIQ
jgi:hypothetical protein